MTLEELNDRYALLEAPGKPSAYISRNDRLPIQENDLRRRLADEAVLIGMKKEKPVYQSAYIFWTGHARRHIYQRIAFTSKERPRTPSTYSAASASRPKRDAATSSSPTSTKSSAPATQLRPKPC